MTKVEQTPRYDGAPQAAPRKAPAPFLVQFWRSAIGKKWVMAITGIMLIGFVFGHMVGNLKIYLGAEALDHYAAVDPDVVLLDIVMPDLDGIEVMRHLRERRPVPVILLTAKGSTADKAKGLDLSPILAPPVNKYGQSWDIPNLFLVGSSSFPTMSGFNPTLTIEAHALLRSTAGMDCDGS